MVTQVTQNGAVTSPKRIEQAIEPAILSGTTDIDDSAATETTAFMLLAVTPAGGSKLRNVKVVLDLDKATTGFGAVESTATLNFHVGRKVDGTNWKLSQVTLPTALTGTLAATNRMVEVDLGPVAEEVRVYGVMSADATDDMEIPYQVIYEGDREPTVTAVAAG